MSFISVQLPLRRTPVIKQESNSPAFETIFPTINCDTGQHVSSIYHISSVALEKATCNKTADCRVCFSGVIKALLH